jgi:hypothetical protein
MCLSLESKASWLANAESYLIDLIENVSEKSFQGREFTSQCVTAHLELQLG